MTGKAPIAPPGLPPMRIVSRAQASRRLSTPEGRASWPWVLSIDDPDAPLPAGFEAVDPARRLRLVFVDVWPTDDGSRDRFPAWEDVAAILAFGHRVDGPFLVHCTAGWSRSPAAALLVAAARLGPGREDDAAAFVAGVKSSSLPNPVVVTMGDALLAAEDPLWRPGHLWAATLRRWPRLADATFPPDPGVP